MVLHEIISATGTQWLRLVLPDGWKLFFEQGMVKRKLTQWHCVTRVHCAHRFRHMMQSTRYTFLDHSTFSVCFGPLLALFRDVPQQH